jgi:hypothetical protein
MGLIYLKTLEVIEVIAHELKFRFLYILLFYFNFFMKNMKSKRY